MKLVMLGDLQSHNWKRYPETDKDGNNLRLMDTVNELGRIRKLSTKNKVDAVAVLGDIFEARNTLDVTVLNAVYRAFYDFVDHGMKLILLVGNHDRTDVGREHALEVFKPFCEVIERPTTLKIAGAELVAIPFHPRTAALRRAIQMCVTRDTKLLLMHTAIKQLQMPDGKTWGEGIALDDIPRHVLAMLGHFHRFTELRPNRVWYLGSLTQIDQGDASIDKYFAVYDSAKSKMAFYPTQGPRFVSIDVDTLPSDRKGVDNSELVEKLYYQCAGNFVTVRTLPPEVTDLAEVSDFLKKCGARHVEFGLRTTLPMSPGRVYTPTMQDAKPIDVVKTYVEETDTQLDKEELVETGVAIIEQVSTADDDLEEPMTVEYN